jgi:hypothetical protein
MSTQESLLPDAWIESLFSTMRAFYGAQFDRQWECPQGIDQGDFVAQLMRTWGRELAAYRQAPHALQYALHNLPEHPPNLVQFKALCNRRPDVGNARIEDGTTASPEVRERARVALTELQEKLRTQAPNKAWAWWLRDIELHHGGILPNSLPSKPLPQAYRTLTNVQRAIWRSALATESAIEASTQHGSFTPIDPSVLPPGMRPRMRIARKDAELYTQSCERNELEDA